MNIETLRKKYPGYSDDEILQGLQATQYPDYSIGEIKSAIGYKPATRNVAAVANDLVIEAANAAAGGVSSAASFVSPGNRFSKFVDENIVRAGEEKQSDFAKDAKSRMREGIDKAQGVGDELAAVGGYVTDAPGLAAAQAVGSFVGPGAAIKGSSLLAQAAGAGARGTARAGMAGGSVAGGAMAGGDAAQTAYELVIKAGGTEEQAQAAAREASVITAAVGAAGGVIGAERLFAGAAGPAGGALRRAGVTAGTEALTEGVEEGITQFEGQRAAAKVDPTIDPTKGVAAAAGLGAVLGGITGAGVSLITRDAQRADATQRLAEAKTLDDAIAAANDLAMPPAGLLDQARQLATPEPSPPQAINQPLGAGLTADQEARALQRIERMGSRDVSMQRRFGKEESADEAVSEVRSDAQPLRAEQAPSVLQGMPRSSDVAMAQEQAIDAGAADEGERQILRAGVQEAGAAEGAAVPGLRSKGGDAPRRLQQAAASDVALQGVPSVAPRSANVQRGTSLRERVEARRRGGLPTQSAPQLTSEGNDRLPVGTGLGPRGSGDARTADDGRGVDADGRPADEPAGQVPAGDVAAASPASDAGLGARGDDAAVTLADLQAQWRDAANRGDSMAAKALNDRIVEMKARTLKRESIDAAAGEAATSPTNDRAEPTDAQKEAGNYKKGHVRVSGLDVTIENPKGSVRRSKADEPTKWQVTMPAHYGYIKGTKGSDGDHVDLFIGDRGDNGRFWIINQNHAGTKRHDEHKVVTGVDSAEEAVALYKQSFSDNFGDKVFDSISAEMGADALKQRLPSLERAAPVPAAKPPLRERVERTRKPAEAAAPQSDALVKVKTIFGTNTYVRRADMDGDENQLVRMFTAEGKNNGRIARGNLDPTGEKRAAEAADSANNPLFNVITRKGGEAFATEVAAQRELNARGLNATHEVAPASTIRANADGYVVRKKPAEAPAPQPAADAETAVAPVVEAPTGKQPAPAKSLDESRRDATLDREVSDGGERMTRRQWVERKVAEGLKPKVTQEDRIKPMSRMQFFRANNEEQRAHERKIKEAGKKDVFWIGDYEVTKTEHDYALALMQSNEQPATLKDRVERARKKAAEPVAKTDRRTMQEKVERPAGPDEVVATAGDANAEGERKFYATMVRGDRVARLAGPFNTKAEAEAMVPRAQDEANKADPRSAFDAFGVSAVTSKDHKPGTLNKQLGIDATAEAPAAPAPAAEKPKAEPSAPQPQPEKALTSADIPRGPAGDEMLRAMPIGTKEEAAAFVKAYKQWLAANNAYGMGAMTPKNAKPATLRAPDLMQKVREATDKAESNYWQMPYEQARRRFDGLPRAKWEAERTKRGLPTDDAQPEKAEKQAPEKIDDFGEKIGGARKDTAESGFTKTRRAADDEDRPAWARRFKIAQIVKAGGQIGSIKDEGRWVIRDSRSTDWMGQPRQVGRDTFATKEEAEAYVPIAAVSLKHKLGSTRDGKYEIWREVSDRKRVKVVDQQFDTREEAMAYMVKNAVQIIETNTTFGEADIPLPPDRARTGPKRREGDVKGEDFAKTFGFRGVEFGNWNNQTERQALMNDAFDGMMDLADVLGVPPKALGLNGDLALAFGARGNGLNSARAHYELERAVINLTKERGAGSLAHEWFHALDHYFGRQDGKASAEWVVQKDGTRMLKVGEPEATMASGGFQRNNSGVRPELRAAYEKLLQTMFKKAEAYVEDTAKADKFTATTREELAQQLDALRKELSAQKDPKYYKRNNKPASAELLAEFDTIAKAMLEGDASATATEWRTIGDLSQPASARARIANRWTNDSLERLSSIYKEVRGRSGFDSTNQNGVMDRLRGYMNRYSQRLKMLADAQSGTEKTRMVPTDFAMNAKELDQGRGTDYWTTPHEMAARAFQGYVEDKVAERGGMSRFLNYGPENVGIPTPWGFKRPFPAGTERVAINKAFDAFVGEIQTRETDRGTEMFSVADEPGARDTAPDGQASPRHQQLAAEYQQRLQGRFPGTVFDAVPAGSAAGSGPAGDGVQGTRSRERAAVATVAKRLFGHEVVFVRFPEGSKPLFNGAMSDEMPGVVFINADARRPMMAVLGHELVHQMSANQKALYQVLARRLNTVLKNEQQYIDLLDLKYTPEQRKGLKYGEELHADIVGDFFMEPQFWQDMAAEQPSLFKKVAQAIIRFIDNAIGKITDIRPFGTEQYITDLNAARSAVVDAMRQFSGAQVGAMTSQSDGINLSPGERDQTNSPEFKRWFGDSKVVDAQGKPLVVYHGTRGDFSSFYVPNPEGKQRFYFAADPAVASEYSNDSTGRPGEGANMMPVYVALKKPAMVDGGGANFTGVNLSGVTDDLRAVLPSAVVRRGYASLSSIASAAEAQGYDGVIVRNVRDGAGPYGEQNPSDVFIAFRPEQIKSAIGNRGTFDPASSDINLSIADTFDSVRNLDRQKIRDNLADLLGKAGAKVSWWDKTLGTQYAKAQKFPEFKNVFDKVQQYLEDTSTLANQAADLAPDILPKLETWKDLARSGISEADASAIAGPIYRGTLEDQKAYTNDELRTRFKLNEQQIGMYRQFREAVENSLDQAVAADVLRLLGDVPLPLRNLAINNRAGLRDAVDEYLSDQVENGPEEKRTRMSQMLADIREKYERIDQLKAEGYAPLMRFGRYFVHVHDNAGGTQFFGMYESRADANAAARELSAAYPNDKTDQGVLSQEQHKLFAGVPLESMEMFAEAIGADNSEVFQQYIRLAKNNRSALKRLLHRKGTAGFSRDVSRSLAAFITSNARLASGGMNLASASDAAVQIRDGDVKDEAIKLIDVVKTPTETAAWARSLLFMNFIGGSAASALVNLTQPITMTAPYLSQWGGVRKAALRLLGAGKAAASGNITDPELRSALKRAEDDGIVSPQEIHHLQAEAMGTWGTNEYAKKAAFVWGSMFSLAEQFNRRVTFIAAYQTAKAERLDDPFAFAEKAVVETQGLYNRANAPNWARNPVGATALTFKQFSIHYLEWMQRMAQSGPGGKRAVLVALAIMALTAGLQGLPFAEDLDDLIDTLAQALGYSTSARNWKREFIADTLGFGDIGADVAMRGLSAVPGVPMDVSMRMSMGNLLPATGILLRSNTDRSRDVLEVGGAAGGLAKQYIDAGQKALRGDFGGAAIGALPMAMQNIAKSIDIWTSGEYRDTRDRKIMEADEVDGLMKFVGFQPAEIARESRAVNDQTRRVQLVRNVESEIANKWAQGIRDKDQEKVSQARAELAAWNRNNPTDPINITTAQIVRRVRELGRSREDRMVRSAPRELRASVQEALQ